MEVVRAARSAAGDYSGPHCPSTCTAADSRRDDRSCSHLRTHNIRVVSTILLSTRRLIPFVRNLASYDSVPVVLTKNNRYT